MMRFYPLLPLWLIILTGALAVTAVWLAGRYGYDLPLRRRRILTGLRLAAIGTILLILFCPGLVVRELNRQRSNVIFLLDGSDSMNTADLPGGKTRFMAGMETLERLRRDRFSGCRQYVYLFNQKTVPAEDREFLSMFRPYGGTDLRRAFELVDRDLGFSRTAAVIVISDGLDHSGFNGVRAGLPVFAVKTGTALAGVPDLRIEPLTVPDSMRSGEELELKIPLLLTGFKQPQQVRLTVEIDGKAEHTETLLLEPEARREIPFKWIFRDPGLHTIGLKLNRLPGEAGYLNNQSELAMEVKDEPIAPVLYFPMLTNSFRPLVRLFSATGQKFTAVYKLRDGACSVIGNPPNPAFNRGLPSDAAVLQRTDVLVLGADNPVFYPVAEQKALEKYVAGGGNLILLGGTESFGPIPGSSPLAAMQPVRSSQYRFVAGNFKVALPESGGNALEARLAELKGTPAPLRGINVVDRVKDGAEVLLWAQADKRYPLVVSMVYGRGRVIAVLTNSLHLWGEGAQRPAGFRAFWEQLLVEAGSGRDDQLRISVNRNSLQSGEKLRVTALTEMTGGTLEAAILPVGGGPAAISHPMLREGQLYTAEFSGLSEGRWILQVTATAKSGETLRRYKLITAGDGAVENSDLKVSDENFLKFCTRGRIYLPEEAGRLLDEVNATIQKNDLEREWFPVFETPFALILLLLLLLSEWFLRRRFNLF